MRLARRHIVVERTDGLVSGIKFGLGCLLFAFAMLGVLVLVLLFVAGGAH